MFVSEYAEIGEAKKILSIANLKNKIRDLYYAREDARRERASWEEYKENFVKNLLEKGTKEILKQGIEQGIAEGSHSAKLETARNFLQMGLSKEQVAQGTGLSVEEIQNLK